MSSRPPHIATRAVVRTLGRSKQLWHAELHQSHETKGCLKRQLEAWMPQRLRRDHEHDHRSQRQGPEGDGAAIRHDRDQHDRGRVKRTLRRDIAAGQEEIERGRRQRRRGRPFLDRKTRRQRGKPRKQSAYGKEDDTGHHRHVIAGHKSRRQIIFICQPINRSSLPTRVNTGSPCNTLR
jgi:hypothetical protein